MKPKPKEIPKTNTRAEARRLYPHFPRRQLARWVLAKLRVRRGTWRFPIGEKCVTPFASDFLRRLPPGVELTVPAPTFGEKVRKLTRGGRR